ncbi:glycosyltransferase family 2 protein, partial [Acinetobacter bereziniae]|uniref:glycosyltransferase family 2 protein n=1 Tax=Acinetobacter bereziniae TaxID=106648 RepID=UPI00124FE718
MNVENDIKVSICVVTYNQEKYIAECLESLVQQVTNFRFEIIVGEDCSTDSTRSIVQTYVEKYPNLIVALFHKDNVGGVENIKQVYKKAKGKYIAHMDGDDTALPTKLQKQFDILEQYTDCNICSHDMIRIDAEGLNKKNDWVYPEKIYSLFDLYHKLPFFAHSSKMFRNKYKDLYWDNLLSENYILDIDVHIENARDGHIYHIGEVLGAYRVGVGISIHSKKVNKALGLGAKRVFEKGLVIFSDQPDQLAQIKRLYAYALLQCAYNYAVYEQNEKLFNEYVNLSFELKFIGV